MNYFFDDMILDTNGVNGLLVEGTSTSLFDLRVFNTWTSDNGSHGIFLPAMVKDYEIQGGFSLFNGLSGITSSGDTGKIQGVSSFDNNQDDVAQYGIVIDGSLNTISNCRVYNTSRKTFVQNGITIQSNAVDTEVINNYLDTEGATTVYADAGTRTRGVQQY